MKGAGSQTSESVSNFMARFRSIVAEELPYINLWYFDNVVVHSRRVRNLHLGSAGTYDFLASVELAQ